MSTPEYISWIGAVTSVLACGISLAYSKKSKEQADKTIEISQTQIENTLRRSIQDARHQAEEAMHQVNVLKLENNELNSSVRNYVDAKIESFLNTYEIACQYYFDNDINRGKFSKNYKSEIKFLFNNDVFSVELNSGKDNYPFLHQFYKEITKES